MVDEYHSTEPPSPSDGPQERVDWTGLEEAGHAVQPAYVEDRPVGGNLVVDVDLREEAAALVGDEQVMEIVRLAGSSDE